MDFRFESATVRLIRTFTVHFTLCGWIFQLYDPDPFVPRLHIEVVFPFLCFLDSEGVGV